MLIIRAYLNRKCNMRKERRREVTSSGGVYRFIWIKRNRGFGRCCLVIEDGFEGFCPFGVEVKV